MMDKEEEETETEIHGEETERKAMHGTERMEMVRVRKGGKGEDRSGKERELKGERMIND